MTTASAPMQMAGWRQTSLIDYPGRVAAVVFTAGCNLRCRYCHNPWLVQASTAPRGPNQDEVLRFLNHRRQQLGAVVVSGGEPTLQRGLAGFLQRCRAIDYAIKLDTNGTRPTVLAALLRAGLVDDVALDCKAPPTTYSLITGSRDDGSAVWTSLELLLASTAAVHVRTTVVGGLHQPRDLIELAARLRGCRSWTLQRFKPANVLDNDRPMAPPDEALIAAARQAAAANGIAVSVR